MSTVIPATSSRLLFQVDAGWRVFRAAAGALAAERQGDALPSGWTAKEMLAHVAYWESTLPDQLRALQAGGTPTPCSDVDAENARVGAEAREMTAPEVLERLDAAHARAVEAVGGLDENEAGDEGLVAKVADETYDHYAEHVTELWVLGQPRGRDELLARVDDGWRRFRDTIRGMGRARMGDRTPVGWTNKDLIAHCAAWEELTSRRLRRLRETGMREFPEVGVDTDAFNARVVEAHRLAGPEAVLDELDTAHRLLRGEIAQLRDEQVVADDSRAVAVVAGNTYGHYLEHAAEIGMDA